MQIVALTMAIIAIGALMAAVVTSNAIVAWACIGASLVGLTLVIVSTLQARQQRNAQSVAEADRVLAYDADYPDDRPATDAPAHAGDKEVQREIMREERVLHPDTGPRDPDITKEEVAEAISHRRPHRRS
ncbi:hypothetical protein [Mycobacterium spongiae]|uniref:Uncharacterized protein n=1 Tax=Mycobacterium spongiae TaxID=886343 RepID=A0A975JZP5_9MYCO|nr:hypothetical protein [Mycobacterium spongiae]QUR68358.1 hypothetical protein F6B93_15870 [Mycobacterium spongiae]